MPGASDLNRLLARIGDGLFQQAFVVADLDGAQEAMRTTLGCGEFVQLPASDLEYDLRGVGAGIREERQHADRVAAAAAR